MDRRRGWIGLLVLAGMVLAVLAVMRLRNSAAAGGGEDVTTEVAVHVGEVTRATLHRYVIAYGTVESAPASGGRPPAGVIVGSTTSGILVQIACVEGARVSEGTTLFRLDDRLAQVALRKARATLDFAQRTYERQKALLKEDGTSQRAVLEAEQQRDDAGNELAAAETQLALLAITAPLSGTVVRINARLGQSVEPSTVLAEIVDLDRLVVTANVPRDEAALVKVGQGVKRSPGGSAVGTVAFVGQDIDPRTGTVVVRTTVPTGAGLQPGQLLEIRIVADEHRDCLAVPVESLVTRAGEGSWIMAVEGERAVRKPVTRGLREGSLVEVEGEGLREGMPIVTEDAYSLPRETAIRILGR